MFGGHLATGGWLQETWEWGSTGIHGAFTAFGRGCGPTPVPTLAAATGSRPVIGGNLSLITTNLPANAKTGLISFGVSNQTFGTVQLPLGLDVLGMKGCLLYHSFDILAFLPVNNGTMSVTGLLPNDQALVGLKLYAQSAASNVASNAGTILIGNR